MGMRIERANEEVAKYSSCETMMVMAWGRTTARKAERELQILFASLPRALNLSLDLW